MPKALGYVCNRDSGVQKGRGVRVPQRVQTNPARPAFFASLTDARVTLDGNR